MAIFGWIQIVISLVTRNELDKVFFVIKLFKDTHLLFFNFLHT